MDLQVQPDEVAVVGSGPAGLMAAVAAAAQGARVTLFERLEGVGRKLLVTGGGRCNLTTTVPQRALLAAFGRRGRFATPALATFGPEALREFFAREGVPTVVQEDSCVFPVSQRATDVLAVLQRVVERDGVRLVCGVRVEHVLATAANGVTGVLADGREWPFRAVVLAAGGCSYPELGSDGDGFALARALGVALVEPTPALVPLLTAEAWPATLSGIVLPQARIRIAAKGAAKAGCVGAVLFTHRGLSGPAVLDLSGAVAARLAAGATAVPLLLTACADRDARAWLDFLESRAASVGSRACHNVLAGELPRALAAVLCTRAGLMDVALAQAGRRRLETLAGLCGGAPVTITATEGWGRAMVSRGGVALTELDPNTLCCHRVPGLFCAGECVDLDGPCGGYNLTWAFASGWLAGSAAAKRCAIR